MVNGANIYLEPQKYYQNIFKQGKINNLQTT